MKCTSAPRSTFSFPGYPLIDPMHQLFLGTGKTLSNLFMTDLRGKESVDFNDLLKSLMFPMEFLREPKHVDRISYCKGTDFKLLFFHPIPLAPDAFPRISDDPKHSFCRLLSAVRLPSKKEVDDNDTATVFELIILFLSNFEKVMVRNSDRQLLIDASSL